MIVVAMMATMSMNMNAQELKYPQARKDGTVDEYFGHKVADPYRWMEDDRSAETAAWVEAENKVTNDYLSRLPMRQKLMKRMKEVASYGKVGAPFFRHGQWYQYRHDGLQNQSVLYRLGDSNRGYGGAEVRGYENQRSASTGKANGLSAKGNLAPSHPRTNLPSSIFLDPNKLSDDGTVALKGVYFSNDGRYAAYAISRSGSDWQEFYVMDAKTGELLPDHIEWAKFSGATWQGDGFYYSAYDHGEAGREYSNVNEVHKIYYHKIGTPQTDDVLFYQNPAYPKRFYSVTVNEEETMMFLIESGAGQGYTLFVRDLRVPGSQFIQMTNNMECEYSPVAINGDDIILFTNYGAPKNRLMKANIHRPGVKDWEELVPEAAEVLENADYIGGKLILTYQKDASNHAYVYTLDGQRQHEVKLPGIGSVGFSGNKDRKECYYSFSSFTVPGAVYQYDIDNNESRLYNAPEVKFRQSDFTTDQVFFESKDGTRVPMFITYKKGMKRNGKNPLLLYGYGGFAISLTPGFSAMRIPFLEQGGIYVTVNLRGGYEYGEEWHLAGTKMQKQNVFDDFIAAAEYLIREGYTSKEKLAIMGGSNGGLLVGACMTQRPDLFAVAIPQVGVMDMLRYHLFTIGWNWAPDYGTSADSEEMFQYLLGYSPLHNLKEGVSYPSTLVTTADHDDRVVPAHSFKFAARLQECNKGKNPVLIRIDTKAGHGGGKPMSKVIEEQADIYSFILKNLK